MFLYLTDRSGSFYKIYSEPEPGQTAPQAWNLWHDTSPHVPGFINTGPAVGQNHVYFLMRWLDSSSSDNPGTNHGRLVAVEKHTGRIAWTADLTPARQGGQTIPAWGNVEPLVVRDPAGEWVLTGDTSGHVTAFGPGGRERPFALTRAADETPIPCSAIEDPAGPLSDLRIAQSARVRLTHRPARTPAGQPWANLAGVSTGMTAAQGRLLMGVNEYDQHGTLTGRLVALRAASNLALESIRIEYRDEAGHWQPLAPGTGTGPSHGSGQDPGAGSGSATPPIPLGTELRVRLTVRAELAPGESKVDVPLRVGWEGGGYVETTVTFHGPGRQEVGPLSLPAPQAPGGYRLVALLNPYLYAVRQPQESLRREPGAPAQPAAPPPQWATAGTLDPAAAVRQHGWGEALAVDGYLARTVSLADTNRRPVAVLAGPDQADPGETIRIEGGGSHDPDGDALVRWAWQVDGEPWSGASSRGAGGTPGAAQTGAPETLALPFATPGTHWVGLQVQDERGKWSPLAEHAVTVRPPAPSCGDPGEPENLQFNPGRCVELAVGFRPPVGRRGDKVETDILLGLPADFTVDGVDVDLPEAFQDISYCLGTGECFHVDNTDTRAQDRGGDWHYDFILAWTQSQPPDGEYPIWVGARGTYTYSHLHTRTVEELVCTYPEAPGAGEGEDPGDGDGNPGDGGTPPGEEEELPAEGSEPEPECRYVEREEQYEVTHTVPWDRWVKVWFEVKGHWYPYVEVQR